MRPFLWAVAIVVALELACRGFLPRGSLELVFIEIRERVESAPAPGVQIVGDSVAAGGIIESILANDRSALRNDAVMGSSPTFSYFLLRAQLARGHRPSAVIIAHHPRLFAKTNSTSLIGMFAHWSEVPEILWRSQRSDRRKVVYAVLTRISYLLTYRAQLRDLITGHTPVFAIPGAGVPQETRLAEYTQLTVAGKFRPQPLDKELPPAYQEPFSASSENEHYFRALVELARSNGVRLYWVAMPVPERVAAERRRLSYEEDLHAFLRPYIDSGALELLQSTALVYPDTEFDDYSHLNMKGAIRFSCHLRDVLRDGAHRLAGRGRPVLEPAGMVVSVQDSNSAVVAGSGRVHCAGVTSSLVR